MIAVGTSSAAARFSRSARVTISGSLRNFSSSTNPPPVFSPGQDDDDSFASTTGFVPRAVGRSSLSPPSSSSVHLSPFDHVRLLAGRKPTPLTLQAMYRYASADNTPEGRLRNAQFLHRELPVRIAKRVLELRALPGGLGQAPGIRAAADVYVDYVQRFRDFPVPASVADEERFTTMLEGLVLDRTSIPCAIARGLHSLRDGRKATPVWSLDEVDKALYEFFTARVGMRFLVEHHVLSSPNWARGESSLNADPYYYGSLYAGRKEPGCIQRDCDALEEAKRVAEDVSARVRAAHGACPEIVIVDAAGRGGGDGGKATLGGAKKRGRRPFTYVPHHLRYMLEELLKNACVATLRRHHRPASSPDTAEHSHPRQRSLSVLSSQISSPLVTAEQDADGAPLPPITVVVVKGAEDVTIKLCDYGGGVPRSRTNNIFTFAHSTLGQIPQPVPAKAAANASGEGAKGKKSYVIPPLGNSCDFDGHSPVGRELRGFGLPLTRIYARYFGGELTVKSMEGHGLDVYLYLPVLGSACENLNDAVRYSPGNLDSNPRRDRGRDVLAMLTTKAL